jgi:hypothetical protein
MRLMDARRGSSVNADNPLEGRTNYLLGNDPAHWLRGLPNYARVRYSQIYPGINLVFYGKGGALEHDFELQPRADPSRIEFQLDGAQSVTPEENGDLRIGLSSGAITFQRPLAYQTIAGERRGVDAAYTLGRDGTVRFRLGSYDRAEKLVIDPVLSFATYLSPLASVANLIATDSSGNNYVAGLAAIGFPVTSDAFAGCTDCTTNSAVTFISKLSADGTKLIYSTVLGGNSFAQPTGIAVDGNGNVLVSGWTGASDFPTKNGQPIAPPDNAYLGFLVSLSADGSSLNYGTMLGPSPSSSQGSMTYATAVALDASGNAYVTGETGNGFFTTAGALNQGGGGNFGNQFNVFLAKFSPTGTLIYSAVLGTADPQNGGGGPIGSSAITVDADGDAFVAGQAGILWPISPSAYLKQIAGSMPYATPFVTEVAPDAKSLVYSTYLDYAYIVTGIAVLPNGNVFVAGDDVGPSYPTTPGAYEQNSGGGAAFLTELNSSGSELVYSTVIGDASYKINGLALDPDGDIWLAAETSNSQFPLVDPIQATFPAANGMPGPVSVVNQFDPTGQMLKFSTFLGGNAQGYASSITVDASHKVHVSGAAGYGMYTTAGVYDGSVPMPGSPFEDSTFAYVAVIDPASAKGSICLGGSASTGLWFGYLPLKTTASQSAQVTNCGNASLTIGSITSSNAAFTVPAASNGCTKSLAVGSSCTVTVAFTPTAVQAYSGQLTFSSNGSIATTSIPLSGSGGEPVAAFGPPGMTLSFPPMLVGQTSTARYIELSNNGTVPLTINLAQIAVTSGFALGKGGNCTSVLQANQGCWISVVFAPTTAGTIHGTLSVSSNDPVHPTITASLTGTAYASYPIATITALLNPSYPLNSGTAPITMSVIGTNFFPASIVYINGVAQTTNYQSGTFLTATFSPSLLKAMGEIPVTVVNPKPGGGASASYPLIGYLSLPLTASALTADPIGGLLYVAIPASASQNPNTVIPINPATGVMMTPIAVASDPRALAISDDGSELYVASAGVLQRFNLKTLAIEKTFNLPVDSEWGQTYVQEMHAVPGSPQSIVVELLARVSPAEDGAALYNDAGLVNWLPGVGANKNPLMMESFTFTSPTAIYGLPEGNSFFAELQVSSAGLSEISPSGFSCCYESTGSILASDGTLLYTNSGEVWDPSTRKLLGTYLDSNGSQLFYTYSVIPETASEHTYFLDGYGGYSQYEALTIDVYDQASYALMGTVPFLGLDSIDTTDLVRWGTNGFAFRNTDLNGYDPSANQIVIVTSSLVSPGSGSPIPVLASVSPSTIFAGGQAFTMQLTGSGFTSASKALVNGNQRTTTFVSNSSLTAQVLASDIATNGQLNLQVANPAPGGGTSNYVYVPIQAPRKTTPAVSETPSATQIGANQALTVTLVVSGAGGSATPTGTVTLAGGGYTSSSAALAGGSATISIPAGKLAPGADILTATYSPDASSSSLYFAATRSSTVTVSALPAPLVALASSASSTPYGGSITLTATVSASGGKPTGTIVFLDGGKQLGTGTLNSGGVAQYQASGLAGGSHSIIANYTGDASFFVSSSTVITVNVTKAAQTITFTAPATPVTYGVAPITLTATATSTLAVTFTASGPATVNGNTLAITGAGSVTVAANQAGNGNYSAATAVSKTIVVNKAAPAVSLAPSETTGAYGASVTLTATLTNAGDSSLEPTGTVTFFSGTTSVGTGAVDANGIAKLTLTTLAVGTDSITASYGGDSNYATAKSSAVSIVVGKSAQTITFTAPASQVTYGTSPITLVATASSNLAVTFTVAAGSPATVSGSTLTITGAGTVTVTANQAGNANYAAAAAVSQAITVNPGTATGKLTSSAASVTYGTSVTLTATFTGSGSAKPSGTVTFLSGSTSVGSGALNASGVATLALTTLPAGTDSLTASFPGDTRYGTATTAPITETVKPATPTVKLTSSATSAAYGAPVALTATLTGAGAKPTGAVTFLSGATTLGSGPVALNSSGMATLALATLPIGADSIKASYAGDTNYAAATSTAATVTITKASQTITFTAPTTPVIYGVAPITLVATGGASGQPVIFTVTSGPATVSGSTLTITGAGSVVVAANQAGNGNYNAATVVSKTIAVNKATPTTALTSTSINISTGSSVTFTDAVTGPGATAPGGTITFLDGTTTLGTGALTRGAATYSTTKLAIDKHTITAKYPGDSNYVTVTSAAVVVTVAVN